MRRRPSQTGDLATQIDVKDAIENLRGDLEKIEAREDASIVHHNVDPTEVLQRRVDHRLDLVLADNIASYRERRSSHCLDLRGRFVNRAGKLAGEDTVPATCEVFAREVNDGSLTGVLFRSRRHHD